MVDKHLKKKSRDKMSDVESESMHRGKMSKSVLNHIHGEYTQCFDYCFETSNELL